MVLVSVGYSARNSPRVSSHLLGMFPHVCVSMARLIELQQTASWLHHVACLPSSEQSQGSTELEVTFGWDAGIEETLACRFLDAPDHAGLAILVSGSVFGSQKRIEFSS